MSAVAIDNDLNGSLLKHNSLVHDIGKINNN